MAPDIGQNCEQCLTRDFGQNCRSFPWVSESRNSAKVNNGHLLYVLPLLLSTLTCPSPLIFSTHLSRRSSAATTAQNAPSRVAVLGLPLASFLAADYCSPLNPSAQQLSSGFRSPQQGIDSDDRIPLPLCLRIATLYFCPSSPTPPLSSLMVQQVQ